MHWIDRLFKTSASAYKKEGNFYYNSALQEESAHNGFSWAQSHLGKQARQKYTTTGAETEISRLKLSKYLSEHTQSQYDIILDVGCNDGRLTNIILDMGFQRVIAADIDYDNVRAVAANNLSRQECLVAVVEDVLNLPIKDQSVDFVLAWGILSQVKDWSKALDCIVKLLKPGGTLFFAEPTLESMMLYALVQQDLDEYVNCYATRSRAAYWQDKSVRYKGYAYSEIMALMDHPELEHIQSDGVSVFPSLIFGALLQNIPTPEDKKQILYEIIMEMDRKGTSLYRVGIEMYRKR